MTVDGFQWQAVQTCSFTKISSMPCIYGDPSLIPESQKQNEVVLGHQLVSNSHIHFLGLNAPSEETK